MTTATSALLGSTPVAVLVAFVAINTVMYVALAIAKLVPRVHLADVIRRPGTRAESRSIHPDADR